jgi:hypothetical protein
MVAVLLRSSVFGKVRFTIFLSFFAREKKKKKKKKKKLTFLQKVDSLWPKLNAELQARVKVALLQALINEPVSNIRHKLIDTTSELAGAIFQLTPQSSARDWPELLAFMFQLCASTNPDHRESGFLMFSRLSQFVCDAMNQQQLQQVKEVFARGLHEDDIKVRIACMSSTVSFIEFNFDEKTKKGDVVLLLLFMFKFI